MKTRTAALVGFVGLALLAQGLLVSTQSGSTDPAYVITDLGTFGGDDSIAGGINEFGQVAGAARRSDGSQHAFFYDGTLHDLGTLGGPNSGGLGVNQSGTVVGYAMTAILNQKAVIFSDGARRSLGNFGGNGAVAYGVNDPGDVVGAALTTNNASRAFLYRNGTMKSLGTLGGPNSTATAINNQGEIAGSSWVSDVPNPHAFLFRNGVMMDLGTLGGPESGASGLNNSGFVVGHANLAHFDTHAFLFTGGPMIDLGTLGGHNSEALAINDVAQPQIVGDSNVSVFSSDSHAFLYQNGVMTDLNTRLPPGSGWVLEYTRAINNAGEIAGLGTINGQQHAFLLTLPVRLRVANFGIFDDDSNIPQFGVQVGRSVRFVTSMSLLDDATAHKLVFTDSISGPVTIESVRTARDATVCSVAGSVVTCRTPELGELSNVGSAEEVDVTVRVTGPGVFSHTAHVTADNGVPNPQDTESEQNIGIALKSFALSASTVAGGSAVSGRAELTSLAPPGGAVVHLTSSNPAIAPVPSPFVVQLPTAARTFNIVPPAVSEPTPVTISASYGLVTISQTLTVVPPALKTVSLTRSTMIGSCQTATAKVTLTGSAPAAGASVTLSSTTSGVHVPATIAVAPGATSASLTVGADAVHALTTGTFAAAFGGVTKQLPLSVRPIFLTAVTLTPSAVTGGAVSTGAATIECAAPSGGLSATLASTNPSAAAPTAGSVQFAAGSTQAAFTVQTQHVGAVATPSIRVTVNGVTKSAPLTVHP